jgi:tetratricopeptide (TPR) repeat protein
VKLSSFVRPRGHLPRLAWLVALALGTALLPSAPACAQAAGASEPAAYRETVHEALAEYHAKNFPEAQALFAEAHKLYPNARTLRGLGMTAFELRSYRESIGYLTAALESKVKPLDGSLRAESERLLARAERFVGKLSLTVTPASAAVMLDGSRIEHHDGTPLLLEVGEHQLEFSAEGYHSETRSLHVKGRETETWTVALNAIPVAKPAAAAAAPAPREVAERADRAEEEQSSGPRFYSPGAAEMHEDERPLYKNPWLWTGVGAAVVVAVVVGVVVASSKSEVGSVQLGENTPKGGQFSALESRP